jgi:hypothetical protein
MMALILKYFHTNKCRTFFLLKISKAKSKMAITVCVIIRMINDNIRFTSSDVESCCKILVLLQ